MSPKRVLLSLTLVLGILFFGWSPVAAQKQNSQYFPETGHWVTGEFLDYYQQAKDSLLLYGYPITDAFQDPLTGLSVQYFQRARFELHIEAVPGQRIQLSQLGSLLYEAGEPVAMSTDTPACRYFSNQKHNVCYAFLSFYDNNGGNGQFGYPISELEQKDNLYVQYFEKVRLEWHPEMPAGQRVIVSDLGRMYFDQLVGDPSLLEPNPTNNIPQSAIQLQARIFVSKAVLSPNQTQMLYVVVQDQYMRPVSQADVAVAITFPVGGEERYRMPLTNKDGITQFEFNIGQQPSDTIAQVQVEVSQSGQTVHTGSWFRIWW